MEEMELTRKSVGIMNKNKSQRKERINQNTSPNIVLIEDSGNEITLFIRHIRSYRAINLPTNGTWIQMHSGVEFRVVHSFDEVDRLIESKLNKK